MPQPFMPFAWKVLEKWNTPVLRFLLGICLIVVGVWVAATPPPQPVLEVPRHPRPVNSLGHAPAAPSPGAASPAGPRNDSRTPPAGTEQLNH